MPPEFLQLPTAPDLDKITEQVKTNFSTSAITTLQQIDTVISLYNIASDNYQATLDLYCTAIQSMNVIYRASNHDIESLFKQMHEATNPQAVPETEPQTTPETEPDDKAAAVISNFSLTLAKVEREKEELRRELEIMRITLETERNAMKASITSTEKLIKISPERIVNK